MRSVAMKIILALLCIHVLVCSAGTETPASDATSPAAEPPSVARLAYEAHAEAPVSPDLIGTAGITTSFTPLQPRIPGTGPCATIFGYLPYWESAANVRWQLLTHVACFSVGANPNGTISNPHNWPWTAVINTAHANGVKVILVATQFDPNSILTLITTPAYKSAFFANIKAQILAGNADGVNIDFEGSGPWRSHINGFMAELTAYLHAEIPGCEVTFAGPAVNWSNSWDLEGLAASCDGIFIMGYAFSGSGSANSGPQAPLTGGSINITNTVTVQYGAVTQKHPEKLILGVPYYGGHWKTTTANPRSAVVSYVGSTRFRDTYEESMLYGRLWDSVSQTPWYRWHDGTDWHQVWADDAESLGLKYDLARQHRLAGVGIWALNYDGARPELWDELDRQFRTGCPRPADLDHDGDVDMEDYGLFQRCLSGRNVVQASPACAGTHLDLDTDVDENDLALFLQCFTGPGQKAAPGCTTVP